MTTQEQELPPPSERIEIQGSDGIALRQLVQEDAQAYFELINYDRDHFKYYPIYIEELLSVDDVKEFIEDSNPHHIKFGIWVDEKLCGGINLDRTEMEYHGKNGLEVDYFIGLQDTGHGYAAKALNAIIPFAFDQPGIDRLRAQLDLENKASIRTLEKCGFTLVRHYDHGWVDYELLKSETSTG
jgi:RimJ/RimL family protein N-acetyltransferase